MRVLLEITRAHTDGFFPRGAQCRTAGHGAMRKALESEAAACDMRSVLADHTARPVRRLTVSLTPVGLHCRICTASPCGTLATLCPLHTKILSPICSLPSSTRVCAEQHHRLCHAGTRVPRHRARPARHSICRDYRHHAMAHRAGSPARRRRFAVRRRGAAGTTR